ncbi:prepilin-type N-terminal cleavage/methylation domain-containing protein [Thioalkalivibrio sp. XN279]|uniref:prepilin-type N-terminal cleavage/methylation domain-containing protein n=1 Tax=Thioalkalivibrio sp. XN279 TaxID=2714953 RepID=UPI00140BC90E|nr:prepilin-type N-terminal cleavage/methylation domain-containing protein [Thioalkalivibrio sp. XN279]NHA14901.1 prepilin-type N-terminal cleavage/methylation domain-containing protein [Thioalkalivibrio sp. XN279]
MKGRCARGFSLVEVLVAMTLALLLTLSMTTLHARVLRLSLDSAAAADAQDALRIALALLEYELAHAGYWGLVPDAATIEGRRGDAIPLEVTVSGDCGPDWSIDLDRPLQAWSSGWPLECAPYAGAPPRGGMLVLRRVETGTAAPEAGRLQVQADFWGGRLVADADALPPGYEGRDLVARAYYVSPRAIGDVSRPALRRKTLQRGPRLVDEEIMPGIAALEIELGVDADLPGDPGHGQADAFVAPETATAPVVAVRLTLRSHDAPGLVLTRTVPLRNGPLP